MKKQVVLASGMREKIKFFLHGKELGHVGLPEVGVRICGQDLSHLEGCRWDGSHRRSAMALCPARSDSSAQVKPGGVVQWGACVPEPIISMHSV